jgi:hypothetical protein
MLLHRIPQVVEEEEDEKEEEEEAGHSRENATRRHQRVPKVPAEENGGKSKEVRVSGGGDGGGGAAARGRGRAAVFFLRWSGVCFLELLFFKKKMLQKFCWLYISTHIQYNID